MCMLGHMVCFYSSAVLLVLSIHDSQEDRNKFSVGGFVICKQKVQTLFCYDFSTQPFSAKVQRAKEFFQQFYLQSETQGQTGQVS